MVLSNTRNPFVVSECPPRERHFSFCASYTCTYTIVLVFGLGRSSVSKMENSMCRRRFWPDFSREKSHRRRRGTQTNWTDHAYTYYYSPIHVHCTAHSWRRRIDRLSSEINNHKTLGDRFKSVVLFSITKRAAVKTTISNYIFQTDARSADNDINRLSA